MHTQRKILRPWSARCILSEEESSHGHHQGPTEKTENRGNKLTGCSFSTKSCGLFSYLQTVVIDNSKVCVGFFPVLGYFVAFYTLCLYCANKDIINY